MFLINQTYLLSMEIDPILVIGVLAALTIISGVIKQVKVDVKEDSETALKKKLDSITSYVTGEIERGKTFDNEEELLQTLEEAAHSLDVGDKEDARDKIDQLEGMLDKDFDF